MRQIKMTNWYQLPMELKLIKKVISFHGMKPLSGCNIDNANLTFGPE